MSQHHIIYQYPADQQEHEAAIKGPKYAEVLNNVVEWLEAREEYVDRDELLGFIHDMKMGRKL